jgi:hypothetical protein
MKLNPSKKVSGINYFPDPFPNSSLIAFFINSSIILDNGFNSFCHRMNEYSIPREYNIEKLIFPASLTI